MEAIEVEQQLCPCHKDYQNFQKLMELEESGLVVYCHRRHADNTRQGEAAERTVKTSRDVFILHNKKDVRIKTSQLTSELEKKNINCPRCRKTFEHAQELMLELKLIDRKIVIGICDHCRKRAYCNTKPFCVCDKIVKLFKSVKDKQTDDTKKYEIEHLRKEKQKQKEICTHSDLQINLDSAVPRHEPEVQQMFSKDAYFDSDDIEINKTDSKGHMKQSVTFVALNKPIKTSFIHTPNALDPENTSIETYLCDRELPRPGIKNHKQEEIFKDSPSVDAKEELKRRHDISLRQMLKLEKASEIPFSISKRSNVYETPKLIPWEQKKPTPKSRSVDKEKEPVLHVAKSKSVPITSVGKKIKPQFSFLFLQAEKKKESQVNLESSSTVLIKDTQERFRLQAEILKKRKEAERLKKLEDLAREAKQLEEEKQKQELEKKKKMAEEQQRLAEMDKFKELASTKQKGEASKQEIKSKSVQIVKDRVSEKIDITGDKSKHEEKGKEKLKTEGEEKLKTEGEEKLKTEGKEKLKTEGEEKFKTEVEEKLQTENKAMLKTEEVEKVKTTKELVIDAIESKKGEGDKELQGFKPSRILRDKNLQVGKKKIPQKSSSKGKVETSKARKSSNIDESINKKNKEITEQRSDRISIEEDSSEVPKEIKELQKLQAQYLEQKRAALKKKEKLDLKMQKANLEWKAQKAKQEAESKADIEKRIKLAKRIKIKQPKKIKPSDIDPELIKDHKLNHSKIGQKSPVCPVCLDSDLEIEVLSLDYKRNVKKDKLTDIIIGEKIYKKNILRLDKTKKPEVVPIFLQKDFNIEYEIPLKQNVQIIAQTEPVQKKILSSVSKNVLEQPELELGKGIIRYALSDRTFIAKGWTMLPTEKVVRKVNVYRMRPAHPEFDWFEHNKSKGLMTYDTGEKLAEFDDNGRGRWYYRNGRLALDYYDAKETNAQQRFVVYSSGEPDERGRTHPITILATFDYLGNGIVLDHAGKIRLKYNQNEGMVLDRTIGPVSHWKWHTLNDPPVLQQVMIDTEMAKKDPNILKFESSENYTKRSDNEEMLAIEFDNFIKEKTKKLSQKFQPFQIKMKALKINEHFSLKVLDQTTVYLIFRDGLTNLKVNMGMLLDEKEIVDSETSIVGDVLNSLERFPARTDSLAGLQCSVAHAKRYEKKHAERERRLKPPMPCTSADLLNAAASPPMRLPLRTMPTGSSTNIGCSSTRILY